MLFNGDDDDDGGGGGGDTTTTMSNSAAVCNIVYTCKIVPDLLQIPAVPRRVWAAIVVPQCPVDGVDSSSSLQ